MSDVWYGLHSFRKGSQSSAVQIVPDVSMHGCVALGEMTWTRPGHSGLPVESFWGQLRDSILILQGWTSILRLLFIIRYIWSNFWALRMPLCEVADTLLYQQHENRIIRINLGNVRLICWNFKEEIKSMQILSLSTHSHTDGKDDEVSYST